MAHRPAGLWDQHRGKGFAELMRGASMPLQPHPCALEPPFDEFDRHSASVWDCYCNGWVGPWDSSLLGLFGEHVRDIDEPFELPAMAVDAEPAIIDQLAPVVVEQFAEDEETIAKAGQFVRSLSSLRRPVAFEVLGLGPQAKYDLPNGPELMEARRECRAADGWTEPSITVQFVADRGDAARLENQLLSHHPSSAIVAGAELQFASDLMPSHDILYGHGYGATLGLDMGYLWPLRTFTRLDPDPLGVALACMEQLDRHEWAFLQVLFEPVRHDWADNLRRAVGDPYKPGEYLFGDIENRHFRDKFSSPLFAVSIRIAALQQNVYRALRGWAEQFAAPPQKLVPYDDENEGDFSWSLMARCTCRPGILLNADELASIVHLPAASVASERLRRVKTRTRPAAAETKHPGAIVLGENVHRGRRRPAIISADLRPRHCYVAGASGTGKSTLLLNMICQDLQAGRGLAVLDPHGDLIKDVLRRVPENRTNDVIYFDPGDEEYPFALNIIEAKDDAERERIVHETIMALEKYFPASWGPRLERILMFTLQTVTASLPGATLADVEWMLTDLPYRDKIVGRCPEERLVHFWRHEMPLLPKNACDPVLNKLSPFLTSRVVRNIICQRRAAIDFDQVVNKGQILLANLSTGMLTERIAGMLGSFLVTKLVNAAFRRAAVRHEQRRPFYLYVDEFQAFMNLSIGFERILAEARKYRLALTMANQYVGQLTPSVRQAIFGNVGVMTIFRLGVDDANLAAKEMGIYTADEIMNLERGQALVRAGGSQTAHNVNTYPPPQPPASDPTPRIVAETRRQFAHPRAWVERGVKRDWPAAESRGQKRSSGPRPTSKPSRRQRRKAAAQVRERAEKQEPRDPSEDDLVN